MCRAGAPGYGCTIRAARSTRCRVITTWTNTSTPTYSRSRCRAAGRVCLFRSAKGRFGELSDRPMSQSDVYRMIGRRAEAADVATKIGCHSFRATGITEYLQRRKAGNGSTDGQSRKLTDDRALRPTQRSGFA